MTTPSVQHAHTDDYLNSFPYADMVQGKVVADIGPGDGYATEKFLNAGAKRVFAFDIDFSNFNGDLLAHGNLDFYKGDLAAYAEQCDVDIVWSHHCLEHVDDPLGFLKCMATMLPDNGWLWLAVPNMAHTPMFSPGHIHNFTAPSLLCLLQKAGFDTKHASVWAYRGQLRIKLQKGISTELPEPMEKALNETGRCDPELLAFHNWDFHKKG